MNRNFIFQTKTSLSWNEGRSPEEGKGCPLSPCSGEWGAQGGWCPGSAVGRRDEECRGGSSAPGLPGWGNGSFLNLCPTRGALPPSLSPSSSKKPLFYWPAFSGTFHCFSFRASFFQPDLHNSSHPMGLSAAQLLKTAFLFFLTW